jgi:hypothetical protein
MFRIRDVLVPYGPNPLHRMTNSDEDPALGFSDLKVPKKGIFSDLLPITVHLTFTGI